MEPKPIHPYDFYELIANVPVSEIVEVGKVDETITGSHETYTIKNTIWRINGTEYRETTTVPFVTKAFDKYGARK